MNIVQVRLIRLQLFRRFCMHSSTKLPIWHCVQLLEIDAFPIPDVAQIREASVDEAQFSHPSVVKELRIVRSVVILVVAVISILVFGLVLPYLVVVGSIHLELLLPQVLELQVAPKSVKQLTCAANYRESPYAAMGP